MLKCLNVALELTAMANINRNIHALRMYIPSRKYGTTGGPDWPRDVMWYSVHEMQLGEL